jgi:prolipoprotein diacylglyceryltransferase
MHVPIIFGMPLHIWLGILMFLLILFQVATGSGLLKTPFVWHRANGYAILLLAVIHGLIGVGLWFRVLRIG